MVEIKSLTLEDAKEFADIRNQIDAESLYMAAAPGERKETEEKVIKTLSDPKRMSFVAKAESKIVGYISLAAGQYSHFNHVGSIWMGIIEKYRGQGIGTQLIATMEKWAREHNIRKLELEVIAENKPAIALYTKTGFITEGAKKESFRLDDKFLDSYIMAKFLR